MRDWLAEERKKRGMTQREVADKLDISESYYNYIESGERQKNMDLAVASKLSVVFGMTIEEIIAKEGN